MSLLSRLFTLVLCIHLGLPLAAGATLSPAARAEGVVNNPLTVLFETTGQGVSSEAVFTWSFGDGSSAVGDPVQHSYAAPGVYFVTLQTVDGTDTTTQTFRQVVGDEVASLDFEGPWPPEGWMVNAMDPTPEGAITGSQGYLAWIVNPNPGPSCAMPVDVPPDKIPRDHRPRRWLLSGLVDLSAAQARPGTAFDLIRVFDGSLADPIFAAHLFAVGEKWNIEASAARSTGGEVTTVARPVGSELLQVELGVAIGYGGQQAGSVRLRVSLLSGETVVDEEIFDVENSALQLDSFDFGLLESTPPSGGPAIPLRMDEFRVLTDSCLPPSGDQLLGHWDFEDAGQIGLDLSGEGRHGQAMAGATTVPGRSRWDGTVEQALELDGAGYLQIPNLGLDLIGEQEISLEAWVKVSNHSQMNLFRTRQPFAVRSDALSASNYVQGSGWESVYPAHDPPVDEWYHLAVTFDHGVASVWFNGVLAGRETLSFSSLDGTSYANWALGARIPGAGSAADQFFVGQVDDVKIYRRVLTDEEIESASGHCGP